ncbi:hypothetical protein QBC43DRAFT_261204 [Cladorrhinum sp. PSN259]|nr:hypothetical protein QBC43DRAFT_261204 [Cladorrhinum sp. PSN259]
MATPLSPTPSAALNASTPSNPNRESYEFAMSSSTATTNNNDNNNNDDHSPSSLSTPRGPSPSATKAARPGSRIISGNELSPLKILQQHQQSQITQAQQTMEDLSSPPLTSTSTNQQTQEHKQKLSASTNSMAPPPVPPLNSPRKAPIIKRFPVRVSGQSSSSESSSPVRRQSNERQDAIMHDNHSTTSSHEEGFKKRAIEIFEDDESAFLDDDKMDVFDDGPDSNHTNGDEGGGGGTRDYDNDHMMEDHSAADDTAMSTFSTFSAVPNLTMLANMRSESPTKFSASIGATPRGRESMRTPRGNGPVPDRSGTHQLYDTGSGNGNLMDFTDGLRFGSYNSQPTPSRRAHSPNVAATPQRQTAGGNNNNNLVNLLDFDIPPMPTPRSIPTITPRELESLKSGFLSEISSLKASLSGKEAEVLSLKTAVGDAEKRVGECLEQLREVENMQQALTSEKDSWERRGREMETVLRKVKEEIVLGQREREELEFKLDEAEKRREAAEMMAQDAESKMAGMRAGKAAGGGGDATSPTGGASNKEVEMAVERVARELHALYKSKHETKVAALKKSYETRWEKKVRELQGQVDELVRENEELRRNGGGGNGRDAGAEARIAELEEGKRVERAQNAAHVRELQAECQKLEAILKTVQSDNADLRVLLERERVEKGELVQLAEEMMNMQQSFIGGSQALEEKPESDPEPEPVQRRREIISPEPETRRKLSPPVAAPVKELTNGAKTPARRQSSSIGSFGGRTPMSVRSSMPPPSRESNENAAPSGNNFRMSVNGGAPNFRASGLRAPGSGIPASKPSMIGRAGSQHGKSNSVAGALPRPGSGQGMSRGLMGSIEKMGAGGSSGYGMRSSRYNAD